VRVNVKLFAVAKQRTGLGLVTLELPDAATVADLRRVLAQTYPSLAPLVPGMMIAVDAEYAGDDREIGPEAEVAAIPPVSGGQPTLVREELRPLR
jgi:molybdopterin converting factor small subunit